AAGVLNDGSAIRRTAGKRNGHKSSSLKRFAEHGGPPKGVDLNQNFVARTRATPKIALNCSALTTVRDDPAITPGSPANRQQYFVKAVKQGDPATWVRYQA